MKKKWKSLRDTFGKELRKIPEGRSGDEGLLNFETYTSWPYFESMLFLKNQMRPRKSGGNLSAGGGGNDDVHLEQHEDVEQDNVVGSLIDPIEVEYVDNYGVESATEILPPSNPPNRPTKRSAQQQLIDIEARKLKLLESKATLAKSSTDDDEDAAFFKSLLPHVRKLKPEEKMEFRMDVQGLVQKYVYKRNKSQENPFLLSHSPLGENSDTFEVQRDSPHNSNAPFAGIAPLSSTTRNITEGNNNNNILMEIQNKFSAVTSNQRQNYSVITSPISSVASQK